MFGLMRGCSCTLNLAERRAWRGYFCGLCLALKDNHGQLARIATNHDAALLAVLCDAQDSAPTISRTSYCALRRPFKITVADSQAPGAKFAASMALLMATTRIEDHIADSEQFWGSYPRFSVWVSRRWQHAAYQTASETGFAPSNIAVHTRRQEEVESTASQAFFYYSQPTELATAAAFQHTAVIANQPQNIPGLFEAGCLFGRIMYLLDSYQDLAADHLAGRFNALAASFEIVELERQATLIFQQAFATLQQHLKTLHFPHPQLIRKLLRQHLQHKAHQILDGKSTEPYPKLGDPQTNTDPVLSIAFTSEIYEEPVSENEADPDQETTPEEEMERQEGNTYSDPCYWSGGSCGEDDCDCDGDGDCDCGDMDCGDFGGLDCGDCGGLDCG